MPNIMNSRYTIRVIVLLWLIVATTSAVEAQTPPPPYTVEITVSNAKLRTGPGANFSSNGYATQGERFTVYQESLTGEWLLVHQNPELWISFLQVKMVTASNLPNPSGSQGVNPDNGIAVPILTDRNIRNEFPVTTNGLVIVYFLISVGSILTPLLGGLHWRWFIGSVVSTLLMGPIGFLLSIYIAWLVIIRSEKIVNSSPKELLENIATSSFVSSVLVLAFFVLTAVSILGGVLVIGSLYIYFRFVLLLMPGGGRLPSYTYNRTPLIESGSASKGTNYSSRDDNNSSNDYEDDSNYPDDSDDDDDDKDTRSVWDGWLMKW